MTELHRKTLAEFVGTTILVFFGAGTAVFGVHEMGTLGVALAFGLILLVLAYAIGPVSGCHVNPAVTLGLLIRKGIRTDEAVWYWIAQFAGGLLAAALLKLLTSGFGDVTDQTGALGTQNWGVNINGVGAFVLEVVVTFLLVFVVILVTGRAGAPGFAGLAIGLALGVTNLVAIPLDGASVNPARSFGPAVFNGGEPLKHVWLFILAPLIGGGLAALVAPLLETVPLSGERAPDAVDPTGADVPGG